jgi:adenosylcobinamide-phosphate synthase
VALDVALGDPQRAHPVAGFGRAVGALETRLYADSRARGASLSVVSVGSTVLLGRLAQRAVRGRGVPLAALIAVATWTALGGASLGRAGDRVAAALAADDLDGARAALRHLCARDARGLTAPELARASIESVAENTSDAVVAPLLWGVVAGVPGLLGYRAVNTLDAMVGYRSARYRRFGWASARSDDLANWVPARVTAALTVVVAPCVGGGTRDALRAWRRDGARHPSPNAGRCEAAFAGALGLRLGGRNTYDGYVEDRPTLGDGRPPAAADIHRAVLLSRLVGAAATVVGVVLATALHPIQPSRGDQAIPHPPRRDQAIPHPPRRDQAISPGGRR